MCKVLRASKAGFPCLRNLFYSVNGYDGIVDERSQRIFDVGTYLEPAVVEWLKADGWHVDYNPGSQNAEFEVEIPLEDGSLKGHPDCFISRPEMPNVLADIKTMNDRAFAYWKKEGTLKNKPQYVDQLHIYAMGAIQLGRKVDKLAIVGVNKNNSDLHIDFFDYDILRAADIEDRAELLFALNNAPSDNCPAADWCCDYCEFAHFCEIKNKPKPFTPVDRGMAATADPSIIQAMQKLANARKLAKSAKELEDEAKNTLYEQVAMKGLSGIQGGGFTCTITEKSSSRFDSTAFKKVYPELVQQFTKTSSSLTYDVKEV